MQPQPGTKTQAKKKGNALLGALGLLVVAGLCIIGAVVAFGGEDEPEPAGSATVPYTVVNQKGGDIAIEVDRLITKAEAEAIATELRGKQSEETGYYVSINCSTGGTAKADNRLGNARFGLGALGKARTGLDEGVIEVELNEGRTCPAQ